MEEHQIHNIDSGFYKEKQYLTDCKVFDPH